MGNNSDNATFDGAELFAECLAQATLVVKQVLPSHYINPTPDAEWDVRDLLSHMVNLLESVPNVLIGRESALVDELEDDDSVEVAVVDLAVQWQQATDQAEAALLDSDLEDSVNVQGEQLLVETFLIEIAGDLLIHTWDLGEAIGMPVKFPTATVSAVLDTVPSAMSESITSHVLASQSHMPPKNSDPQSRLLALFGRTPTWRLAS